MRPAGNTEDDRIIKRRYWDELDPVSRQCVFAIFDDRDKVVKMWRELGVACFQVAPGDF